MKKHIRIIEPAFIFLLAFIFSFYNIAGSFNSILQDMIYQMPRGINNKIKIIGIDNTSLTELGPFGTWSRSTYADIINALGDYPAVITLDIMLFGSMDEEGDAALREACSNNGHVISGSYINYSTSYGYDENGDPYINFFNIESIEQPYISDICSTGFVNSSADADGTVRTAYLTQAYENNIYPSLALGTYQLYCERTNTVPNTPSLDSSGRMWINYAGNPYEYEEIPFSKVLNGEVDPRIFKDCIVLIGAYASGLQDQFTVPNSADQMYGVEIHANIIQCLIDGIYPVPANNIIYSLSCAAISAGIYLILQRLKLSYATVFTIGAILLYVLGAAMINKLGFIIPVLYTPLFILAAYFISFGKKYVEERLEKRKITKAFKKYVAPQVVDEIAKSGSYQIKLGGENRHIAVLFVDIRGFTPLSESLAPEQVVDILNSYLDLTTNAIFNNGGTLDKFIGDATMAIFNAPFDLDDYVFKAVKTAYDIVQGGNAIESKFLEKYGKSVAFGVGVNCGNAVVGNIGCNFRMDYTAIGDTVNTAARLESNAKRGQVLISEEVYLKVKDRIEAEPIGEIPLKGKSKNCFVYSLINIKNENNCEVQENEKTSDNTAS